MSEKRKYYRRPKHEERRPMLLERPSGSGQSDMQPKIILKTRPIERDLKENKDINDGPSTSADAAPSGSWQKTIIVSRSDAVHSPSMAVANSPNTTHETGTNIGEKPTSASIVEPIPKMTRPITVISSMGLLNVNAKRLLMKTNTDFFVVGAIGMQGVGKSTVLNLLANESFHYDYYNKVFFEQDNIFPTKIKQKKCCTRSRTESTHMFITSDRMILLDTPPVLSNSYNKDMVTNELDDLNNLITMLSVCHLLIVVQDDYFNMSLMRLLRLAELVKPLQDSPFVSDHFPSIMFVKNRVKRMDYENNGKETFDKTLKELFKDSQLCIYLGQIVDQQNKKKTKTPDLERRVNSYLIPNITDAESTPFHRPLQEIVENFRSMVFATPRNNIHENPSEFNEIVWFDLLYKLTTDIQKFFFHTYENIYRKHLEVNVMVGESTRGTASGTGAPTAKDNWREEHWRDK